MADKNEFKPSLVAAFTEDVDLFRSNGYAFIKATRGGQTVVLQLPIRSSGVAAVAEKMRDKEPKAPSKAVYIYADSVEGRQMKLNKNTWIHMPDMVDEGYLAAQRDYQEQLSWAIVLQALDVPFKAKDGSTIEDDEAKVAMLKKMGISSNQLSQLVSDVNELTALTDRDRERFFVNSSE